MNEVRRFVWIREPSLGSRKIRKQQVVKQTGVKELTTFKDNCRCGHARQNPCLPFPPPSLRGKESCSKRLLIQQQPVCPSTHAELQFHGPWLVQRRSKRKGVVSDLVARKTKEKKSCWPGQRSSAGPSTEVLPPYIQTDRSRTLPDEQQPSSTVPTYKQSEEASTETWIQMLECLSRQ